MPFFCLLIWVFCLPLAQGKANSTFDFEQTSISEASSVAAVVNQHGEIPLCKPRISKIQSFCHSSQRALRLSKRLSLSPMQFQFIVQSIEQAEWNLFQTLFILDTLMRKGHWERMQEFSVLHASFIGNAEICRILWKIAEEEQTNFHPDLQWNCTNDMNNEKETAVRLDANQHVFCFKEPFKEHYWNYKSNIFTTITIYDEEIKSREILHFEAGGSIWFQAIPHSNHPRFFTVQVHTPTQEILMNSSDLNMEAFIGGLALESQEKSCLSGWGKCTRMQESGEVLWTFFGWLSKLQPEIASSSSSSSPQKTLHPTTFSIINSIEQRKRWKVFHFSKRCTISKEITNYTLAKEYLLLPEEDIDDKEQDLACSKDFQDDSCENWILGPFYQNKWSIATQEWPVMKMQQHCSMEQESFKFTKGELKGKFGSYWLGKLENPFWTVGILEENQQKKSWKLHYPQLKLEISLNSEFSSRISWNNIELLWTISHFWCVQQHREFFVLLLQEDEIIQWQQQIIPVRLKVFPRRGKAFTLDASLENEGEFQERELTPLEAVEIEPFLVDENSFLSLRWIFSLTKRSEKLHSRVSEVINEWIEECIGKKKEFESQSR